MSRCCRVLDAYSTDEPGFREGHPEDRCPLDGLPVADHFDQLTCTCKHRVSDHFDGVGAECNTCTCGQFTPRRGGPAKWPHRRLAAWSIVLERISRG